ncbi:hypothetical protein BP00DRAFT_490913 [Aspergillus indologenus CBS 114.80]|uniref:FluG domain protein n=1 Tax=Aspergillus indologenus CBS 114.80 TaxID=1450541 RepID=A0A2V5ING0_9EURO|nr:hypothetical protein BP00DRAFT_490913 [Aspergillus indologenus CBS 114.80]
MAKTKAKTAGKIDWNSFVQEFDPKLEENFTPATRKQLSLVQNAFQRFTSQLVPPNPDYWLKNITLRVIEGFLRWYLDVHNVKYQSGFLVFPRYWRMYWCEEMDSLFPHKLRRKMTILVSTTLSDEYELDRGAKTQPPFNIDDLLFTAHHLIGVTDLWFPTARCRSQLNTLRKIMASTSARPGTLVESSGYLKSGDALKWKDIELYMVKHPDDPSCQVLLIRVKHRLNKGKRNKGIAPVFTYTERNDSLGLCVIQDILEYAFLDDAFDSGLIQKSRDIWRYTKVPEHRLKILIFRKAVQDSENNWVTHPTEPLGYYKIQEYEVAASRSAGFRNLGSLYKYRKGAAANLRHLDEHSRNAIMGHKRSAFMETPARDALLKFSSNASLTRDASAPQDLTKSEKEALEDDPDLLKLKHNRGTEIYREFHNLQLKIRSTRKTLYKSAKETKYKDFFENVGNTIIEQNFKGKPIEFKPDFSHILPERRMIAGLEFKNRDVNTVDDTELMEDRIRSLELRLALHKLNVPKQLHRQIQFDISMEKKDKEDEGKEVKNLTISAKSASGLECPDTLQRHFNSHQLSETFPQGRECDYPGCDTILDSLVQYKYHQATEHGIFL